LALTLPAKENELRRSFDCAAFGGCAQDDSFGLVNPGACGESGDLVLSLSVRENELRRSLDCAAFGGWAQDDSVWGYFAQLQRLIRIES